MRTELKFNDPNTKQIIDTVVNFWIEQSFTKKAIQNIGTQWDGFLNVKNLDIPLPSKYQIEIFRRAFTAEFTKDSSAFRLLACGRDIEIDYDIPDYFDNALLVSGINPKLMPRKTWVLLDSQNMLETGEVLPFYIRANVGYRSEAYYLKPYKLQTTWREKIYNLKKKLKL